MVAVDKEWEKLEKISAWNLTKVRSKNEVIDEARTKGAEVRFASLMVICHLKSAELVAKHQKIQISSCIAEASSRNDAKTDPLGPENPEDGRGAPDPIHRQGD